MTQTTPAQAMVGELRALLEKATQRPWWVSNAGGSVRANRLYHFDNGQSATIDVRLAAAYDGNADQRLADYELIVAAVNALPTLLDLVESLSARAGVEGACRSCGEAAEDHEANGCIYNPPSKPGGADREALQVLQVLADTVEARDRDAKAMGCKVSRSAVHIPYDACDKARAIIASLKGEGL